MTKEFDVVIAGYGPTGATLARLLSREGMKVLVLEREASIFDKPRAIGMDHEALRLLQFCGIAHQIFPHLRPYQGSEWRGVDNEVIRRFVPARPPFPLVWPANVTFLQPQLERMLQDKVESSAGVTVMRSTELVRMAQDDHGVVVGVIDRPSGQRQEFRGKYLVGCDGANSVVRKHMGSGLDDLGLDEWWVVIDALRTGDEDYGNKNVQYCDPARPGTYVVGPGTLRRWEFRILPDESPDDFRHPERAQALLESKVDTRGLKLWRSAVYRFQARVAQSWRDGRIFIAGDAAHQTPPHLGQGMVSGLRDAGNLAWRIAHVEAGAPSRLLDAYQQERQPHFRALVQTAKDFGEIIGILDPRKARQRDAALKDALARRTDDETRQQHVPGLRAGLIDLDASGQAAGVAGQLFMQPMVQTEPGPRMLDDLLDPRFVLILREDANDELLSPRHLAFFKDIEGQVLRLRTQQSRVADDAPFVEMLETDNRFNDWMRQHDLVAVIVRPDRYVYGGAQDRPGLERLLSQLHQALRPGNGEHEADKALSDRRTS